MGKVNLVNTANLIEEIWRLYRLKPGSVYRGKPEWQEGTPEFQERIRRDSPLGGVRPFYWLKGAERKVTTPVEFISKKRRRSG